MKTKVWLACVFFLLPALSAAQFVPERTRLFVAARYSELAKLVESEIEGQANPPNSKLVMLCAAYGKLKRYNKLFACLDQAEANVKRGDTASMDVEELRKNSPLLMGFAALGSVVIGGPDALKGDVRPMLPIIRAEAYIELRDYDKAMAASRQALQAIPLRWNEERTFRIQSLTALGLSHALAGKRAEAIQYAQDLAAVSTSYPYTGLTKDKVMGVARIYMALGEYQKAYDGLRSDSVSVLGSMILGLANIVGGGISGMRGESLFTWQELPNTFMAVKTAFEVGKVKEAKEGYDKLLSIPRVRDNGEIYWVLLADRGRIAQQEGDMQVAVDYWLKAIELIEQQRSSINTEANKIGFVGDKQAVYSMLIAGLIKLGRMDEAFDYVERSKSRALVDMLASKKDFSVQSGSAESVGEVLDKLQQQEVDARSQDDNTGESAIEGTTAQQRSGRSLGLQSTLQSLKQTAPELLSLVSVSSTPVKEVQGLLPQDEALVEYFHDSTTLYTFVLTREGLRGQAQPMAALETHVRSLREQLETPQGNSYLVTSQQLYAQLLKPTEEWLAGKSKLVVIPHGVLHYLPFAALHDGNVFLLDKVSLRFLPSASVIKHLRPATKSLKTNAILVFGNPDLGNSKYDLKFAEEEAKSIAALMPQSRVLVRKDATESALRKLAPQFNYLHFAMHGDFKPESPLDSALLMSGDPDGDGRLTVDKLYSMRLDADLATLSACETGLGKIASGDDVIGLTRGFLYAGASSVVSSLWQVDDQATAELMKGFYKGLSNKDKRESLRQAQIKVRENFAHPYYWAAFQLTGNAQ